MKQLELKLYNDLLGDIKTRVRQAQYRATLTANSEMIRMYWDIGGMIATRQELESWGKGILLRLAVDMRNELTELKGFSERNLQLMVQFHDEYPTLFPIAQLPVAELNDLKVPPSIMRQSLTLLEDNQLEQIAIVPPPVVQWEKPEVRTNMQRAVAQLTWAHNVVLIQKIKDLQTRLWYARQTLEQGWSRDSLIIQIKNNVYLRQGGAVTNFDRTLPSSHSEIARQLLKDPYLFDFLTLSEPFHERELESVLTAHIQKFSLSLVGVLPS